MDGGERRDPDLARGAGGRRSLLLLLLVLAVHAVLVWFSREPGLLTREDDAEYITLAESLRQGGYNKLFRVDAPVHPQYPPGYPALLAVWGAVFGDGFDALTLLTVLLSVASLALTYALLRRVLDGYTALLTVAVLAVSPHLVRYAGAILSEIPYTLLTVLVLFVLTRERPGPRSIVAAAALAVLAALTRSVGVTLVGALGLYWLLERRYRTVLVFGVVSAAVLGAWFVWTLRAPEQYVGASYIADFSAADRVSWVDPVFARIPRNLVWYAQTGVPWALGVLTIPGTPIDNAVSVLVLGVAGLAGLAVFRKRWRMGLFYTLAYGALLAFWVWKSERFVVPVLFLVVAAVVTGAQAIGSRFGPAHGRAVAGALAGFLLLGGALRSGALLAERLDCGLEPDGLPPAHCVLTDQASWFEAVRWIRANAAPDAVVLAAKAAPLWRATGRRTVGYMPAITQEPARFLPFLREQGADYILLGSLQLHEPKRFLDLVEANCSELTVAAFFPARTWLFSLEPARSTAEAGRACEAAAEYRELNRTRDFERDR